MTGLFSLRRKAFWLCGVAALAISGPVLAGEEPTPDPQGETHELEEVVVTAAGFEQRIEQAPASISLISRAQIEEIRAVSLAEIAARQEISLSYLEQLFARLRKGGLVRSVRGPGGGYRLARGAHETTVAEIVLAVDEPIRATRCAAHSSPRGCMMAGERCITHNLWEDLGEEIQAFLAAVSLEDVVMNRTGARRRSITTNNEVGAAA